MLLPPTNHLILAAAAATFHFLSSSPTGGVLASPQRGPPQEELTAQDGPQKLTECTPCDTIVKAMLRCQRVGNNEIRDCVCIPNSDRDNAWYGWIHKCTACLSSNTDGNLEHDNFFSNMAGTVNQLFVSCTNNGGGVSSDGASICASNAMFEACTGLKSEEEGVSWASFERFGDNGEKGNGTQVLSIEDPWRPEEGEGKEEEGEEEVKSSSSAGTSSSSSATTPTGSGVVASGPSASGSGSASPTGSGEETGGSAASDAPASETSVPSSSGVAVRSLGSVAGVVVAMGFGAAMLL